MPWGANRNVGQLGSKSPCAWLCTHLRSPWSLTPPLPRLSSLLSFLPQPTPCWTNFAEFTEVKSCNTVTLCVDFHSIHSAGVAKHFAHQVSGQDCAGFLGTYTRYIKRILTIFQKKRMMLVLEFYCLYVLFLFLCMCISLWVCVPYVCIPWWARRGCQIPWNQSYRQLGPAWCGCWVIWKSNKCSLNYWALSSPILFGPL